ncbi:MAG: flagellar basal body P-ring protein FlgI [Alphaproteobacteria bacterium]|nr:flagellar basal body P-ring protein FlgI [Alphaproteobacteria bacterium]
MTRISTTKSILRFAFSALFALAAMAASLTANAQARIKDIAEFEGIRENQLIGYGLVVGLNGTGDGLRNAPFTKQSLEAMLERLGVNTRAGSSQTKNVAAVMVTANLPAFSRQGMRIDVTVSTLGDAKSLQGGTLLVTPLMGADGEVYAVGQGPVASGFTAGGEAATVTKGVPTAGRIANGAIVEREVPFELASLTNVRLRLRNPDLTTSRRIAQAVNAHLGAAASRPVDPGTVHLDIPAPYRNNLVGLMTEIEQLNVIPDVPARVVIDEKSGVIVMGKDVRVDTVAIAHGNLTIRVTETPQVSQPSAFSATGTTTTVARTDVQVDEAKDRKLVVLERGVSLQNLVDGLNGLGVSPRDLITILQTIKAAGALQAEIQML